MPAVDSTNPALWDAVYLHFEGATYGLDNIEVGRAGFARPFGAGCAGSGGLVELTALGSLTMGGTVVLEETRPGSSLEKLFLGKNFLKMAQSDPTALSQLLEDPELDEELELVKREEGHVVVLPEEVCQ